MGSVATLWGVGKTMRSAATLWGCGRNYGDLSCRHYGESGDALGSPQSRLMVVKQPYSEWGKIMGREEKLVGSEATQMGVAGCYGESSDRMGSKELLCGVTRPYIECMRRQYWDWGYPREPGSCYWNWGNPKENATTLWGVGQPFGECYDSMGGVTYFQFMSELLWFYIFWISFSSNSKSCLYANGSHFWFNYIEYWNF